MFDRFTERARKTIIIAKEEALRFRHDALDCEHLLLGLIQEGGRGVGITALQRLNVDLDLLRSVLKDIEGFSQEEIAEILKKPLGTIKARISRGRSQLKKELEDETSRINFRGDKEIGDARI